MQKAQEEDNRREPTKNTTYFSEYETYESSFNFKIFKKNQTPKMMRKLKQVWNRQRYLTDNEDETSKDVKSSYFLEDSSMDYEVDEPIKSFLNGKSVKCKNTQPSKSQYVRKHQRTVSSSDEQLNVPQKMKQTKDSKQQIKTMQNISMKEQLQQLASISSAFQDESLEKVRR